MLEPGIVIQERYEVVKLIGKGGMGAVYEAIDHRLKTTVALKQTLVNEPKLQRAFEHEAQILAQLRHPALTKVSDHFTDGNGQFLVMEYIPGSDLGELLQQRTSAFDVNTVMQWAENLLDALDYLHTQSIPIIHRDIKPQNLKLTPRGEIILLDFGLAKGSASLQSRVTTGGSIFGYTPKYAPIEQIQGTGTDPRSDLYALAATLYHLLTNTTATDALVRVSAMLNGSPDPLTPPHVLNPSIPTAISEVLVRAMAMAAKDRPASALEMKRALQAAHTHTPTPSSAGNETIQMHQTIATTIGTPPSPIPDPQASMGTSAPTIADKGTNQSFAGQQQAYAVGASPTAQAVSPKTSNKRTCLIITGVLLVVGGLIACVVVGILAKIGKDVADQDATSTAFSEYLETTLLGDDNDEGVDETATAITSIEDDLKTRMTTWNIVFDEPFDTNDHGWQVGENKGDFWHNTTTIENSAYTWNIETTQGFVYYEKINTDELHNFYATIEITQREGSDEGNNAGLMFRYQQHDDKSESYYMVTLQENKQFHVYLWDATAWKELYVSDNNVDAIVPGNTNVLEVIGLENHFYLWINGLLVYDFEDDQLESGSVGLIVSMKDNTQSSYVFDNIKVRSDQTNTSSTEPTTNNENAPLINDNTNDTTYTLVDTFDDDSNAWQPDNYDSEYWNGSKTIVDGVYRWDAHAKKSFIIYDDPKMPDITHFMASVEARRVEGPDDTTIYALIFCHNTETDSFYEFKAADDQTFKLSLSQGTEWTTLLDWQPSMAIVPGVSNELKVIANNNTYTLYINGTQVGEFTNDALPGGTVGMAMELQEGNHGIVEFDNFIVEAN